MIINNKKILLNYICFLNSNDLFRFFYINKNIHNLIIEILISKIKEKIINNFSIFYRNIFSNNNFYLIIKKFKKNKKLHIKILLSIKSKITENLNINNYKNKIYQISYKTTNNKILTNKKFEILNDVKINDIKFINKINEYLGNVEYKNEKFGYVEIKDSKLNIFKQYFNYFKNNFSKINLNHYLKIYSFFDNNKILTEPIDSLLNDELENKKIFFNYMQIETILFNITLPLKNYVEKFEQNYIISTSHIFRVNEDDFKFCPFIHDLDSNNYGMTKNVEILAFIILDMALRNFEMIDELSQMYELKAKEIFTKTLRSILKGKVSEITTKAVIKMLNDKKNVVSLEEIYNFLKE